MTVQCTDQQSFTCWTKECYLDNLQEYGWGITYRSRNDTKTAGSSKFTLALMAAPKLGKWSTLYSLLVA